MRNRITLTVPIKARPECRDATRAALLELARETRKEAGNIDYVLHEVVGQPNDFLIYENWKDQAALDSHMTRPYLKKFLEEDGPKLLREDIRGAFLKIMDA